MIDSKISKRIISLRYLLAVLIVFLHASWAVDNRNFLKFNLSQNKWLFIQQIIQVISYGAVPVFFTISAYLQGNKDYKYSDLLKNKFNRLVIPYCVWICVYIVYYYMASQFSFMKEYFSVNKELDISSWKITDWLSGFVGYGRSNNHPIGGHLWFVRDLIILFILFPVIKWFISKAKILYFGILIILYLLSTNLYILEIQSLFYFSLGIYFSQTNYSEINDYIKHIFSLIELIILLVFLCIPYVQSKFIYYWPIRQLFAALFLWELSFFLIIHDSLYGKLEKLSVYSFFIYAFHIIVMLGIKQLLIHFIGLRGVCFFIVFVLSGLITTLVSTLLAWILKKNNFIWNLFNGFPNKKNKVV